MPLFDFDSVKTRMSNKLKSKASWANILFWSTNQRLIDSFAEEISEVARYDEYLTREVKWKLAQNKSSLLVQSPFLGYKPHRKIGAKGTIRFGVDERINSGDWSETRTYNTDNAIYYNEILYISIQDSNLNKQPNLEPLWWTPLDITPTNNISIPKYTIFKNEDSDIFFTSVNTEILTTSDNWVDIDVVEGIPKSEVIIANGDNYEEIEIDNDSIENTIYELYINAELWEEINDIREATNGEAKVYSIKNQLDFSGIILNFGNNIYGKKLELGDNIEFKYIETTGSGGNVSSEGIITEVESTIYDSLGVTVDVYIYNFEKLDGGNNEENIEDIRVNAPKAFQTGGERVTNDDDYTINVLEKDYVSKVNIWGAYEYNIDNGNLPTDYIPTQENLINICAFTPSGEQLNTTQKDDIRSTLLNKKDPTNIIKFFDTIFINMKFVSEIIITNKSYPLSTIRTNVITKLNDNYSLEYMNFEQNLYESDYKRLIDESEGVSHHNTYIEFYKDEQIFDSIAYTGNYSVPLYPVKTESIRIYYKHQSESNFSLLGYDDGSGNFIGANISFDLTGSEINYTIGTILLKVNSGLSEPYNEYELKIYWRINEVNIELLNRRQILRLTEYSITPKYLT